MTAVMPDEMEDMEELVDRFRRAGCLEPESWASSEIRENIAQFARFVFLRELWKTALPDDPSDGLAGIDLTNEYGDAGLRQRLKASSASIEDLTALVRAAKSDVVRKVAYLLDGYAPSGGHVTEVNWGLFELDAKYKPKRDMGGLHESVEDKDFQPSY